VHLVGFHYKNVPATLSATDSSWVAKGKEAMWNPEPPWAQWGIGRILNLSESHSIHSVYQLLYQISYLSYL